MISLNGFAVWARANVEEGSVAIATRLMIADKVFLPVWLPVVILYCSLVECVDPVPAPGGARGQQWYVQGDDMGLSCSPVL